MDKFIVYGGARLVGETHVSGAKNAVLPLLSACLLTRGKSTIHNVPDLRDVRTMLRLLQEMGAEAHMEDHTVWVDTSNLEKQEAAYDLVRTMRASVLVLGPLTARYGKARVSLPGGCAIGARPINLHLMGLERLGASIELEGGYVIAQASRLKGTTIRLEMPTVTGTGNLMMAASLAEGRTIIENAAREPEIQDLAKFINQMGGKIKGAGTGLVVIDGVDELQPIEYSVMHDRIEAGTLLAAGVITRGDILVKNCPVDGMGVVLDKLRSTGATLTVEGNDVRVQMDGPIEPVDIRTQPHPGFPTDMQAQMMALMTVANGRSTISETIFENRFMHVSELRRMGADIICEGSMAVIRGREVLQSAPVMATDLRASACLVLAGMVAEGATEIRRIYHLDRGYERIEDKLHALGARIQRVNS
ncbi:MAG: UDP-N-acetylglucosamine 1-carboxyvinyltransferase [Deltaproteobacteria bacterium]|nr:MAG: UDP-N-acetylglucosamine 1-carboxyvinyltransferase [Deltaproteobacteria bacterium]